MAFPTYSTLITAQRGLVGDSAPLSPPAGYLWVVRDIAVYSGNLLVTPSTSVTGLDGTVIWQHTFGATGGYQHDEGRWVIPAPLGFLQLHADFPCDFYISGYTLTLP